LKTERKSRQEIQTELKRIRDEHGAHQTKLAQLFGGQKSPEEQETEAVKAAIAKMYPGLTKLTPEMLEKMEKMLGQTDALSSSANAIWDMRANQAREFMFSKVAAAMGVDKLSDRQQDRVIRGLVDYLDSDDAVRQRYEAGDNGPLDDYVKEFVEDWFEPAKRRGIQSEVDKLKKVPSGRERSIPGKDKKPLDFNKEKDVQDALVEAFKSQGGKFGR